MAISAGLAGGIGGAFRAAGQASTRWLDLSIRRQEQERQLAQRQRELEQRQQGIQRQRDLQSFKMGLNLVDLGYKTNSRQLMDQGFATIQQSDPELELGQWDFGPQQKEVAKNVVRMANEGLEIGTQEAILKSGEDIRTYVNSLNLPRKPEIVAEQEKLLQTELSQLATVERQTEGEIRRGLIGGTLRDRGQLLEGEVGLPRITHEGREYFGPEEEIKPEATKQVWDKTKGSYIQATQAQINQDPDRYGRTEADILKHRRAGAPITTIGPRAVEKKEALTRWHVEKDPEFVSKRMKEFKSIVDVDLMKEEDKQKYLQDYVITSLSGLYKDPHFRRNKVTGEIQLWDGDNRIRSWPRIDF